MSAAPSGTTHTIRKTMSPDLSEDVCLPNTPDLRTRSRPRWSPRLGARLSGVFPLHDFKHRARPGRSRSSKTISGRCAPIWWSQTGSNRRPHACKARALPTELWPHKGEDSRGGSGGPPRSLCAITQAEAAEPMVGLGRLERPTSPLSGVRSNHLSYRPRTLPRGEPRFERKHLLARADLARPRAQHLITRCPESERRETKTAAFRQWDLD